ncbi:MAG: hypothetical protein EON88_26250 [Brevundimonas sp.]|nr:MAG: hypothetical protein EON88_26250 [Brevundimonas sp.]
MTTQMTIRPAALIRPLAWSGVAALLLLPAVAMRFTDEVNWTAFDFAAAGVLLVGPGLLIELVVWRARSWAYRAGAALALLASVLLVWVNGAVGIINAEGDPANLLFGAVLIVALVGALLAGFRARGMSRAMLAAAGVQAGVAVLAASLGWGVGDAAGLIAVVGSTVVFTAIWLGAAALFRRAAV